jgi:flavin reductase (DIM6/NTAB) family NADH-FMN oxidoreductase RutF
MDTQEYRALMGRFATGVTVVTTMDERGHPAGLTANSLSSVSLEPCLLSIAVERWSESLPALLAHGRFAVNILHVEQEDLARVFASPARREERWAGVDWHPSPLGCPILEGSLAWFDCSVWKTVEAGDHALILGEISGGAGTEDEPLVYYRGGYRVVGS